MIIVDIDQTIANYSHRGHFDWDKCLDDYPITKTIDLIKKIKQQIIFITAREEKAREKTLKWLKNHFSTSNSFLYMKRNDDIRPSEIVKKELLLRCLEDHKISLEDISYVFEDKLANVKMFSDMGLFVVDVSQGRGNY